MSTSDNNSSDVLSPEERAARLAWPTFDGYCGLHGSGPECGHEPEERRKRRVYAEKIVAAAIREAVEAEREAILALAKQFNESEDAEGSGFGIFDLMEAIRARGKEARR